MDRIEHLILKNLIYNEPYARKVLPYLQPEYFEDRSEKVLFEYVNSFISTYNNLPSREALTINLNEATGLHEDDYEKCIKLLGFLE